MWSKIKLIQALMGVLFSCKNEEDAFNNEGDNVVTTNSHVSLCRFLLWCPRAVNSTIEVGSI